MGTSPTHRTSGRRSSAPLILHSTAHGATPLFRTQTWKAILLFRAARRFSSVDPGGEAGKMRFSELASQTDTPAPLPSTSIVAAPCAVASAPELWPANVRHVSNIAR